MWMVTTKMPKKNRLKPAHEPIVVAQKPFEGSIQDNFDKWGVGITDIDSARVPWDGEPPKGWIKGGARRRAFGKEVLTAKREKDICEMVLSFGEEIVKDMTDSLLDNWISEEDYPQDIKIVTNEALKAVKKDRSKLYAGFQHLYKNRTENANPAGRYPSNIIGEVQDEHQKYFYAPRVTRKERGEYNDHPTPKPISLMSYLVKIYCPPDKIVLDPFSGSGSTGLGTLREGRRYFGIDMDQHYNDITEKRIAEHFPDA